MQSPISKEECAVNVKFMTDKLHKIDITQAEQGKDIAYIKDGMKKITDFVDTADDKYAKKKFVDRVFWFSFVTFASGCTWAIQTFISYLLQK